MTYPYEKEGIEIDNEKEFRRKFCATCKWQEICEDWELETGTTLYTNHIKGTSKMLIGTYTYKVGVFRCPSYSEVP